MKGRRLQANGKPGTSSFCIADPLCLCLGHFGLKPLFVVGIHDMLWSSSN
jgi:hypothetical protein